MKNNLNKDQFLNWYTSGSDQEQHLTATQLGQRVIEGLNRSGQFSITIEDLINESLDVYIDELNTQTK